MKLRNKKTGKIWETVYDNNRYGRDGYIWFYAKEVEDDYGAQYFSYASIKELNEEWEDYVPEDYKDYVKEVLQKYFYETHRESDAISKACKGDCRHHRCASNENRGRYYAVEDIARALGIDIKYTPDDFMYGRDELPPHDGEFYKYSFEEEE